MFLWNVRVGSDLGGHQIESPLLQMGKLKPRGVGILIQSHKAGKAELGLKPRMPDPCSPHVCKEGH